MITVVITNLTAAKVDLPELYTELGASGSSTASLTITRSMAQLDSLSSVKSLLNAGTISVSMVNAADNVDIMSIPVEQHGVTGNIATTSVAIVNTALVFPKAFGAIPRVFVTLDMSAAGAAKATAYVDTVTATGCNIKVDVTVLAASSHCVVNWFAVY